MEDEQGTRLARGHVHTGLDVGVEVDARPCRHIVPPKLESLDNGVAGELGLGAYEEEELAHFGLEDYDQGNDADIDDAAKYLGAETHVEEVGKAPADNDGDHRPEDADGIGAFDSAV